MKEFLKNPLSIYYFLQVGLITRGDVVRAALKIKHAIKNSHKIESEKL